MVNFSFLSIVLIGVIFLVAPTYQRGNLFVDTIYGSAGDVITIDTLEGTNSTVTDSTADTVEFQKYESVSINAQSLSLSGSFGLIDGTVVSFTSTAGSTILDAGNNLYVNGDPITINSQGDDVVFAAENGEINSVSGLELRTTSRGFNIKTDVGGALINSQGGDINIESSGNLIINSKDELNIFSTYDLEITTPKDITFNAVNGTADITSLQETVFSAESLISLTANNDLISINSGDNIIMNSNGFGATGSGSLKVQSFTSSLRLNSFETTSFTSNSDLTIQGETKGVSMFSTGATTGIIQLTSSKSIFFTSEGKGDENTGVLVNVDSVNAVINRTSTFFARGDGVIRSNGDASFSANGAIISNTTGNVDIEGYSVSTTSSTGFALNANDIYIQAFDEATSGNTLGFVSVNAANVRFNTRLNEILHGGDISFLAGLGDLTLTAGDVTLNALRGDNTQHAIQLRGNNLSLSGKDGIFIEGGNVGILGFQQTLTINGPITLDTPALVPGATISALASDDITYILPTGSLTSSSTGSLTLESFYANGNSGKSGVILYSLKTITLQSSGAYDFSYISKGLFSTASTSQTSFSGYLTDYTVTNDFTVTTQIATFNSNEFNFQSGYFDLGTPGSNPNRTYSVSLRVGRDLLITTPRNAAGDDKINVQFASLNFTENNLFFTGLEQGLFTGKSFDGYGTNSLDISSDDRENINFYISSLTQSSTSSLVFQGDSTSLVGGTSSTISATSSFSTTSDQRGFLATSDGSFLQQGNTESFNGDNINVHSNSGISFFTDDGYVFQRAGNLIDYYSDHGPVNVTADTNFDVSSSDSIYFNTGDNNGDLFSVTSSSIFATAAYNYGLSVSDGNLSIYGTGKNTAVVTATGAVILGGLGPVSLTTGTLTFNSRAQDVFGGDITVQSTAGDIKFVSSISTTINSTIGTLTAQELDKTTYEILFKAGNDINITTTTSGGIFQSDSSNRLEIVAKDPSNIPSTGNVYLEGADATFSSTLDNQFIQFTSGGLINVTSDRNDISMTSNGDVFIDAKNSAQFYAHAVTHTMGGDITFNATTYSCVNISSISENVNFNVANRATKYYNDLEFKAKDFVYFQSGEIFTLSANGYNTKRQNEDGNTNGDLIYNEEISAVLRTRNESGNIYFDSQDDTVNFSALEHLSFTSLQREFFYALQGQDFSVTGGSFKAESESGNSTWRGGHNYEIQTQNAFFYSTQNTTVLAEDAISIASSTGPVSITANSGDIFFNTYYQNAINVTSNSNILFNSGSSGAKYIAQGDVRSQSTNQVSIMGSRGVNLLTNVGPITFTSKSSTSFSASEELFVNSGNDVVTNSGNNTLFSGYGVAFSSTAGDISIRSQDNIISTSETVILQASGTSQTGRDRVYFSSTDISYTATSTYIDAAELVQIGKTTLPTFEINAGGTATTPGVVFEVASSTYFTTQGALNYFSVRGTNTLSATAGANFYAEGSLLIGAASMNVQALLGSVVTTALGSIVNTISTSYVLSSDHAVYVTSNGINTLNDGISFTHTTFTQSGILENTILTGLYTATSSNGITINSPNQQGGTISFETEAGNILLSAPGATGDLTLAAYLDIQLNSVNYPITFGGKSLTVSTTDPSDPAPITFQTESSIVVPNATTFTATGDFIALNTYSGDITLSSPLITFNSVGPFISNSTEGSQTMRVTTSGAINVNEFVEFNSTLDDITVTTTLGMNVVATYGDIHSGDDISMTMTTAFTSTSLYDMSLSAFDTLSIIPSVNPLTLTLTATTENIYAETHNDLSHFAITVNTLKASSQSLTFKAGTSSERTDFILATPDLNIDSFQTSIVADPTSLRTSSPIYVNSPNITQSANTITYVSKGDEDGFGTINIDSSGSTTTTLSASDDIAFISDNARVQGHYVNNIQFIGTTHTINTNGLDAIVSFEAITSITLTTTTLNTFSEQLTRVAADSGDLTLSQTGTPTTISVTGPNDGDGTGIDITGLQSITMSSTALTNTVSAARYFAKERISLTARTSSTFSGNTFEIHAHSGRENFGGGGFYNPVRGNRLDFVGVHFSASTINVGSVQDMRFEADLFQSSGTLTSSQTSIQFNADKDFQITTKTTATITAVNDLWVANQGIVQSHTGTLALGGNGVAALTSLVVNAGKDDITGKIQFIVPPSGSITSTSTGAVDLHSNDNVLISATKTLNLVGSTGVLFESHKGDIAVRSVSVTRILTKTNPTGVTDRFFDVTYEASTGSVHLRAGRSIRHIDHWGLGFFQPQQQNGRPGAPRNIAADQQVWNVFSATADCTCNFSPNNCDCPNAANRIIQMYNAFLNYGLMLEIP